MAKERKTRKQKQTADARRQMNVHTHATISLEQFSTVLPSEHATTPVKPAAVNIVTASYNYLSVDLRKTLILTGSIIIVEFLLRFLAKS